MPVKLSLVIVCLLLCLHSISQAGKNPPGTIAVNDTLFVDIGEVDNAGWREYLSYLLRFKKDSAAYLKALPIHGTWQDDGSNDDWWRPSYRFPSYNEYPITGISYEQAVDFCEWRTKLANQYIYFKEKGIRKKRVKHHMDDVFPIRFYYRLPTKQEWETIAAGKYLKEQYPYGYPVLGQMQKEDTVHFHCRYSLLDAIPANSFDATVATRSLTINSSGCYNMIGNVAEMVAEKGIAKGGSYRDMIDECSIINDQLYKDPTGWLGFRCVAVKIK